MRGVTSWGATFTPSEKPAPRGERLPGRPSPCYRRNQGAGGNTRGLCRGRGGRQGQGGSCCLLTPTHRCQTGESRLLHPTSRPCYKHPQTRQAESRLLCSRPLKSGHLHLATQQVVAVSPNSHSTHHAILGAGGWPRAKVGKCFYLQTRPTLQNRNSPQRTIRLQAFHTLSS